MCVHHAEDVAAVGPRRLAAVRRLYVQVLQDHCQPYVALGEPLEALLGILGVLDYQGHLGCRELVVVDDVLVHTLEAGGLVEGGAALGGVLPPVEDRLPLLLLEDTLIPRLRELRPEPVVVGVLLHLLERDDVRGHGFQLLQDQVLPPRPRQRPLLAVGIYGFCGVQVRQNIPVHHLELFAQPLGIEGAAVADHPTCPCLLRRRDNRACGDCHTP
mmetsp:Transcript_85337/g.241876  ORF Transcript_85337/g.241876 Transcript_85337/m.241876 type:complete len:215 (+) Transcript_85337:443-1087(+)